MSIKKLDVLADYRFLPLGAQLRVMIKTSVAMSEIKNPEDSVNKFFSHFIKQKVPILKNQIQKLLNQRNISNVHFSLTLYMNFFIYLDELIEHYQAQQEERDEKLDKQLQSLKYLVAESSFDLWDQNPKELQVLIQEIKNKLIYSDILPPNFDQTISLWIEILRIQYVGDLNLAQIYDKTNLYHMDFNSVKISRQHAEQSFLLVLHLLSKDVAWVTKELQEKIPVLADENLEKTLSHLVGTNDSQRMTPVSTRRQSYERGLQQCLHSLSSVNFDDSLALKALIGNLIKVSDMGLMNSNANTIERLLKGEIVYHNVGENGQTFIVSEEAVPGITKELDNYHKCNLLVRLFLTVPLRYLNECLQSLVLSNELWKNKNKVKPPLASETPSLLPIPIEYDEKIMQELLSDTSSAKAERKGNVPAKKKGQQNKKPAPKAQVKSPPPQKQPTSEKKKAPAVLVSEVSIELSSIEQLRMKLSYFCETYPSPELRQALWHLDALIAFQASLDQPPMKAENCLTTAVAVTSCAHKVLEQSYRFLLLRKEGAAVPTSHNLKHYHQEFDPAFKGYPEIVKKLSSAGNWCRYFYPQEANLKAMSTQIVQIPPVLSMFIKMAEGQALSQEVLKKFVNETIEEACLHAESLLEDLNINSSSSPVPKEPVQLEPIKLGIHDAVRKSLQDFLKKSHLNAHHPVYLHIKQALSALKMLEVSLQKMNDAKDLYTLSAWNIWATQQLQESMENILHAIEYFQYGTVTSDHEMGKLAEKVGLEMGALAEVYHHLSYKTRYPVEFVENTPFAENIDDLEALKIHPEIMQGFQVNQSALLWKKPSEKVSLEIIGTKLTELIIQSEEFLRNKVIPLLETHL